ncbi:spermidine/putrescine ABC transporter ATPase component [Halogeometricum borinquense DSM 11551]|uniref:Molybdate/tungstate import ATP-binding protein WtpC n=1 Tax=Halogeometricum borinquense (strain ATCC 700274 / DSM 11551 / JCM 10706 / KCTC 4070 / PR3) TaxID=469382 RepID=E4NMW8_HALBP|nr:ABC transporter ATP-binding protein [Halogeometricum borinquense]ADQ67380.1 ABC-type spermidine/putrescine transport system, ATPase component [Halogeometricum borinquense DSM 11551]ELY28592.1 spermidine/putrescine ABC transporter ATPase component [Halogeometricum borinquense DSM 11551]
MVALELDGVRKEYGATTALHEVSLSVDEGEFFTLVGPSGCGKTTTLRLVAGLETPTDGVVRFDGEDVSSTPTEDRNVGVVFQNYALFPHMTVRENVAYGLKFDDPPTGMTVDERVSELLAMMNLGEMGDRDPDNLSGGQQQRVALARALAPEPDVLLLDEPMSALDARLREQLRRSVKRVQKELNVTTLYVTHDQEEALAVSDRVAVMNGGRVEQVGTPQDIYRRPETEFVATFVGDNNVFSGAVLDATDEKTVVRVADTSFELPPTDADVGETVQFCVRPEHLSAATMTEAPTETAGETATVPKTNRLTATVETTEFLGDVTRLHCRWAGRSVVVRVAAVPERDRLELGFDPGVATFL